MKTVEVGELGDQVRRHRDRLRRGDAGDGQAWLVTDRGWVIGQVTPPSAFAGEADRADLYRASPVRLSAEEIDRALDEEREDR